MLDAVVQALPRLGAPIMPFLAEEVFHCYDKSAKSVFEDGYVSVPAVWKSEAVMSSWSMCGAAE